MKVQLEAGEPKFIGSFRSMTKAEEVYYADEFKYDENGCLLERKDRPRNICVPDKITCGWLTAIQS